VLLIKIIEQEIKPKMSSTKSYVFGRAKEGALPKVHKAEGLWIVDDRGNRYLDASGGAAVTNVGHGRREIAEALHQQVLEHDYIHPTTFVSPVVEDLAAVLARHAPAGIERFYFLSGGGEAVEASIKMARQIHLANGRPEKIRLISRWKSYHGMSLGALSAMGRTAFREPFAPLLGDVVHIPPPYCLRCSYGQTYPGCRLQCALALDETIQNIGPNVVSAFIGETVSGASLGVYAPPAGYWNVIREICDRYNVLLIQDEVMCGLGRTGRWFASEHYAISPDIVVLGKGLGGGAIALSAAGLQAAHFEALQSAGGFVHGGTYSHHPVAAAVGLATIKILEQENLIERADRIGKVLGGKLKNKLSGLPHVADVRGLGMFWGVELVKDKDTLRPFPREAQMAERIWQSVFDKGVIVYKAFGLAGSEGDAIMIAPAFTIMDKDIDFLVDSLAQGIAETVA
jgi:adenosylmethionine-8-amino-7-oxononanoate aminotransferase